VEVGPLHVPSGEKAIGRLDVVAAAGHDISLPLMVLSGRQPGPVVGLVGAIHGDEYEGTTAIWDLYRSLDPGDMHGAVVAIPIANAAAFQAGSRDNPLDGTNLNRVFPGRRTGTISERIAAVLMDEVVGRCDAVLDLHSGGRILDMLPLVLRGVGAGLADRLDAITRATGLELDWQVAWQRTGMLAEAAVARGVPALTLEVGSAGRLDDASLRLMKNAVRRVLGHLGILKETVSPLGRQAQIRGDFIKAAVGGFFRPSVSLGARVAVEQEVGAILDQYGDVRTVVKSPVAGLVAILRCTPYTQPGDQIGLVGETVTAASS
jgi:predicted deacylase